MYIASLSIEGIKGVKGKFKLLPLTYISGKNHSNKTTIIDAIQVALLGYHPALPKTAAGVLELGDGNGVSVVLEFADGTKVSRGFGLYSGVTSKDYKPDLRLTPCLDHSLYFGKSEAERVQQVMNMSEGLGAAEQINVMKARFKNLKAKDHDEVAEAVLETLLTEAPEYIDGPVQVWLARLLDWAKARVTEENRRVKSFDNTREILTEANAIDSLTIQNNIDALREQVTALREKQSALSVDHARAREIYNSKMREHQVWLNLATKLGMLKMPERGAVKLTAEIEELNKQLVEATEKRDQIVREGESYKSTITSLSAALAGWRRLRDASAEKLLKISEVNYCPVCQAHHDGWKNKATILYNAELKATDERIEKDTAQLNPLLARIDELRPQYAALNDKVKDLTKTIGTLQGQRSNAIEIETKASIWRQQMDQLPDETKVAPVQPPPEAPGTTDIRAQIVQAESKIAVLEAQEAERTRIGQVKILARESRAALELVKAFGEVVKEEQAQLVDKTFIPVLEIANILTKGIISTPLAYHDGRVGRYLESGKFIPVATFSGSELRVAYAAITAGLARQATNKIAVIDELGTFDAGNRQQLVNNAHALINSRLIDQVILLGVDKAELPDDAQLIQF
jgi:uncharacterized coiled-coil DUF342 family protein